jgi:regulator of protease activity HflC (stomatin/prohibitin superfamily)
LKEYERAVIYRFGRVDRVGGPGWTFLIPIFESFRLVDLRTQVVDVPPQNVITKDNVVVNIDAVIYEHVDGDNQSVINSVINVQDYKNSTKTFVIASIREAAGTLMLQELISNLDKLNSQIKNNLKDISKEWGLEIETVEITNIIIPKVIENAMNSYREAEQLKLARRESAEAQKLEIEAVRDATEKLSDKALAYYYVRALEKLGEGQSTKFLFPIELTHLVSRISGQGSSSSDKKIEDMFKKYLPDIKKFVEDNKAGN